MLQKGVLAHRVTPKKIFQSKFSIVGMMSPQIQCISTTKVRYYKSTSSSHQGTESSIASI